MEYWKNNDCQDTFERIKRLANIAEVAATSQRARHGVLRCADCRLACHKVIQWYFLKQFFESCFIHIHTCFHIIVTNQKDHIHIFHSILRHHIFAFYRIYSSFPTDLLKYLTSLLYHRKSYVFSVLAFCLCLFYFGKSTTNSIISVFFLPDDFAENDTNSL